MRSPQRIVLFDGICTFCNASVRFLYYRDPQANLHFANQDSETGRALLARHGVGEDLDALVLIDGGKVYSRSTAALRMLKYLRFPWPLLTVLLLLPAFIRDPFYDLIARNRYQWFGKLDACPLPPPDFRERFLG